MEKSKKFRWLLPAWMLAAVLTTGCSSDENIDLNDIDMTIGVGFNGLELPGSSTKETPLGDLLKTNEGDAIDTLANGDYRFLKGDTLEPARPRIKAIVFNKKDVKSFGLDIPITPEIIAAVKNPELAEMLPDSYTIPENSPQTITTFSYENDPNSDHHQIVSLEEATIDGSIKMRLGVNALNLIVKEVTLKISVPKFFGIDESKLHANYAVVEDPSSDCQILTISNIPTTQAYMLNLPLNKLRDIKSEHPNSENYLLVNENNLELRGSIKMQIIVNIKHFKETATAGTVTLGVSDVDMGEGITVTRAVGYFNPDINIERRSTDIGDIPDFLNDDRVSIIPSNPTLKVEIDNNIDVEGLLGATLVASYDNGNGGYTYRTLKLTDDGKYVTMNQAQQGSVKLTIVVCRKKGNEPGVQYIEKRNDGNPLKEDPINGKNDSLMVYDIAAMLNKIPNHIDIILEAHANKNKVGSIDLYKEGTEDDPSARGCNYVIQPIYEFMTPLALEKGSTIVYNDTIDGWNEDLADNDIKFYDETGYLQLEASIDNNTPLDLVIKNPKLIGVKDINGVANELTDIKLEIVDENGNKRPEGLTIYKKGDPKNQKLMIRASGNMEKLDGIVFEVMAKATPTAETLNASKHSIRIKDVKIKLNGRISIDLNDNE